MQYENNDLVNEPEEYYGVEPEIDKPGEGVKKLMEKPFDPTLISIDTKTPSLDTLIKRIEHGEIALNTESYFQRAPNLWKEKEQSRLIESILIRFPLPAFYFDGSDRNRWLVVDGLQRLSSIKNFVIEKDKPLVLRDLEFLTQLEGKTFEELSRDLQRIIAETTVFVYIINPGTPVDVKFNIFRRINTGGLILEPQEIRHALFQGAPAKFIAELASAPEFEEATAGSLKKNRRMLDRDFANRFLAFYLFGHDKYEPDLDTFMSKAMSAISEMSEERKEKIKNDFVESMNLNIKVFGKHAFRKIDKGSTGRKPINKALFDVFSTQFALLSNEKRKAVEIKRKLIYKGFTELLKDDAFFWAVTSSTGDKNRVIIRHSVIQDLINSVIGAGS